MHALIQLDVAKLVYVASEICTQINLVFLVVKGYKINFMLKTDV